MSKESSEFHPDWREDWREFTTALARRAASGESTPVDVYICLRSDEGNWDNRRSFNEIYTSVQNHTWCANLYVVVNPLVDMHKEQLEVLASRRLWLESALKGGVDDILLLPHDRISDLLKTLRNRSDAAEERRQHLAAMVSNQNPWHCLTSVTIWGHFLDAYVGHLPSRMEQDNFIVAVEKKPSQLRYINELLERNLTGNLAVALVGPPDRSVPNNIKQFCQEKGLIQLRFSGILELHLFLMRLNQINRLHAGRSEDERIQPVNIVEPVIFGPATSVRDIGLLLTSAFDPCEPEDCLSAAHDVGLLRRNLPLHTKLLVHPAVSCSLLPDLLQAMPEQMVWVLLGHGDGASGVMEFTSGSYAAPDKWLNCFSAYTGSLVLAFFSSCRSVEIARRFAQAGACVSVGFAADVLPRACQKLAEQVVHAALRTKGDRGEILQAFKYGCRVLKAEGLDAADPVAFFSVR